jgi:hypothetical protein
VKRKEEIRKNKWSWDRVIPTRTKEVLLNDDNI